MAAPVHVTIDAVCRLVGAIHMGALQSSVAHAVYRVRTLPPSELDRRLADDGVHGHRRHLLRTLRRPLDHPHPELRHLQATLPREGMRVIK